MKTALVYLLWIGIAFLPSLVAIDARPDAWYESLNKPSFQPPSWVFAPVWTTLYLLMGIAAARVALSKQHKAATIALTVFLVHLLANAAWTLLFFSMHRLDLALIDIGVLIVLLITMIVLFWRVDRIAGMLLLPYLAWVAFATVLNTAILYLN